MFALILHKYSLSISIHNHAGIPTTSSSCTQVHFRVLFRAPVSCPYLLEPISSVPPAHQTTHSNNRTKGHRTPCPSGPRRDGDEPRYTCTYSKHVLASEDWVRARADGGERGREIRLRCGNECFARDAVKRMQCSRHNSESRDRRQRKSIRSPCIPTHRNPTVDGKRDQCMYTSRNFTCENQELGHRRRRVRRVHLLA